MVQVIKASILNCLRDTKSLLFNIFFPVFLIVILGITLANNFESSRSKEADSIKILYLDNGDENTKVVLETLKNCSDDMNLNFVEETSVDIAKQKVRVENSVFLDFEEDTINFYANDKYITDSSIAYGVLKGISDTYNATIEIYKVNPLLAGEITKSDESEMFNMESISQDKSPSSTDYYGVAEIGLIIFYFFSMPMYHLKEEKKRNIKDRIKLAGVSLNKYYFAAFIGYSLVAFCEICISYLIARFILGVNYGGNIFIMPIAMLPFITLMIALGIFLTTLLKEEEKALTVGSNVVIPVLCFLGGAYIPISDGMNPVLLAISNISPLRWFNNGLLRYIYGGDNKMLIQWIIIGTVVTLVLLLGIYLIARREELVSE